MSEELNRRARQEREAAAYAGTPEERQWHELRAAQFERKAKAKGTPEDPRQDN